MMKPIRIKFVKKEDAAGCAPACLAMITGKTYREVANSFKTDFGKEGITKDEMIHYLDECGFQVIYKSVRIYHDQHFGREELLEPFAPAHIIGIRHYSNKDDSHVVVMTSKGKIFCPDGMLEDSVYDAYIVEDVIGVYPR